MYTQCPDCRKTYPVTKKHTRAKKAQIYCTDCKKKFNVSALLNESSAVLVTEAKAEFIPKAESKRQPRQKKKSARNPYSINASSFLKAVKPTDTSNIPLESSPVPEKLPWEEKDENKPIHFSWLTGLITGLFLLLGQIIYFEHGKWPQNPAYRPQLEKLCQWLGCELPDYENLNELAVLQGSFTPNPGNTIAFRAAINNQASFRQKLPNIKLTLIDYNEQLIAQRIFVPKDYLSDAKRSHFSIDPDETLEASLTIAAPKTAIGGYNFDLLY
jgi:hypothetical protein